MDPKIAYRLYRGECPECAELWQAYSAATYRDATGEPDAPAGHRDLAWERYKAHFYAAHALTAEDTQPRNPEAVSGR